VIPAQTPTRALCAGGGSRLTGFRNGDIISTYSYNSQGLRASKTVNGNTINHIWDGMHVVMDIGTNADGNAVNAIFRRGLGGQLIDATTTGRHVIYTFDGMGNVVGLINGDRILADYRFDAFGNALEGGIGDGGIHNPFRYRGHGYFDGHSGLHYLRNRFYDPSLGRFITADPYWNVWNMMGDVWAIRQATNLYAFVANNPIMFIDPSGLRLTQWDRQWVRTRASRDQLERNSNAWHATNCPAKRAVLAANSLAIRQSYGTGNERFMSDGSVRVNHSRNYNALIPFEGLSVRTNIDYTIIYHSGHHGMSVNLNSFSVSISMDTSQFEITGMSGYYGVRSHPGSFNSINNTTLRGGYTIHYYAVNLPAGMYVLADPLGFIVDITFRDLTTNTNHTLRIWHHAYQQYTYIDGDRIMPGMNFFGVLEASFSAWMKRGRYDDPKQGSQAYQPRY